jgi:aminoglycoside 6-adenylyltransferase
MDLTRDMAKEVADWATGVGNVRGGLLTSSRANPNAYVDTLSDFDIELFVVSLDPFLRDDHWMAAFGNIIVRDPHLPEMSGNFIERRVIFENAPRIDFAIQLVEEMRNYVDEEPLHESLDTGYVVLIDKDGVLANLGTPSYTAWRTHKPSKEEYAKLVHQFWWEITYVAKALCRDEFYLAKHELDGSIHHKYLRTAIAWYLGVRDDWKTNIGMHGKYLKRLVDDRLWEEIEAVFAGADREENCKAMFKTAELFGRLSSDVGSSLGYAYPADIDRNVTKYLQEINQMTEFQKDSE